MIENKTILALSDELEEELIAYRRKLHSIAEISGTEEKTKAFILSVLKEENLAIEEVGPHGVIATLDTGKEGPCIALRADIDALPMPEEPCNLAGPRTCISENPNTCHACGHDAHTAMLLISAKAFCRLKEQLTGKLYFCFEQGEENGFGAPFMLKALEERKVDACWAIHVYADLQSGKISVQPGPRFSGVAGVDMTVIGKGGHGSRPDLSINPVFCAAAILTNTATAWVNQISAENPVTLGVTTIQGGGISNIIPDTAQIQGSLRYFDVEEGKKAVRVFKSVAEHTAAMNNCRVEFGERFEALGFPVINNEEKALLAEKALGEILPEGSVARCAPWYASESYSRYLLKYPGVIAFLGIKNEAYGSGAAHHNGFFDVDENVLKTGVIATLKYVAAHQ